MVGIDVTSETGYRRKMRNDSNNTGVRGKVSNRGVRAE